MTLRARLAVLTAIAVALAVLAASVAAGLLIRSTLMAEVDRDLLSRASQADRIAEEMAQSTGREKRFFILLQGEPIGVQELGPDGRIVGMIPPGNVRFDLDPDERRLLDGALEEPQLRTETIDGVPHRVMTAPLTGGDGAVRLIRSLANVEQAVARLTWLLVGVAGAGVAVAGVLGWLIARAGLQPVNRLAGAAELVASTHDLAHRVATIGHRRDEVARLAGSMNAMLAALDSARTQQRQLIEDAGHELRTPLATLRNDIGVLRRAAYHPERTLAEADRIRLLDDLETEAAALSDLVGELVDLARGGSEPEPPLETDLRALVDRAANRTRRVNPRVAVAVRGGGFEACVRPATLERAVANLIRNAVQVSPDGGQVDVHLTEADGWARVRVRDRGPGISDTDLPRLFDRFFRGADARERHGSGLGLAIVAQAAEQHGGTVVAANRDGGGAVFTLRFPLHPPATIEHPGTTPSEFLTGA